MYVSASVPTRSLVYRSMYACIYVRIVCSTSIYSMMYVCMYVCGQISAFLLKDCSQNESLADQSLRAAFARFSGANDIASASDSREVCIDRDVEEIDKCN